MEYVYSRVVIRDSMRIEFTMAAINFLKLLSGDVQNA
jgi:hypothetical protein